MKVFVFAALLAVAVASPLSLRKDNPDERGKYYQGDIRLPLPTMNKNGIIDESYRWPSGTVPYIFGASSTFSNAQLNDIAKAMSDYSTLTGGCINWVERTGERDYVRFTSVQDDGCWSYVGRLGGLQEVNYPDWCLDSYGSTMHEMLHTLGFYHQQSASDRDDYVTIMFDNIQAGAENNFDKYDASYVTQYGFAYDYGSVMHYSAYAFSSNGEKTIVTLDPNAVIGQRDGLSDTDIGKLMAMYNC